jgi:hypothetical protein
MLCSVFLKFLTDLRQKSNSGNANRHFGKIKLPIYLLFKRQLQKYPINPARLSFVSIGFGTDRNKI